jgi:flagellar export protein FliJ
MPFVFHLQSLLRVREVRERAEQQKLLALAAQVAATRAELASLEAGLEVAARELPERVAKGVSAAELHFAMARASVAVERRRNLREALAERERAHRAQQDRYRQARQQREILSSLRDQQLALYQLAESRQEQRGVDERFLLRQHTRASAPVLAAGPFLALAGSRSEAAPRDSAEENASPGDRGALRCLG